MFLECIQKWVYHLCVATPKQQLCKRILDMLCGWHYLLQAWFTATSFQFWCVGLGSLYGSLFQFLYSATGYSYGIYIQLPLQSFWFLYIWMKSIINLQRRALPLSLLQSWNALVFSYVHNEDILPFLWMFDLFIKIAGR